MLLLPLTGIGELLVVVCCGPLAKVVAVQRHEEQGHGRNVQHLGGGVEVKGHSKELTAWGCALHPTSLPGLRSNPISYKVLGQTLQGLGSNSIIDKASASGQTLYPIYTSPHALE